MYLLQHKKVLIILDSIEKRGENLEFLLEKLINRCKSVYILTTSREHLRFNDLNPSYY
jgi:5S rRNA maturation endonuclease (ribonuclease M5)